MISPNSIVRSGRIDQLYVQCRNRNYSGIRALPVLQAGFRSSGRDQAGTVGTCWVVAAVFCVLSLSVDASHNCWASSRDEVVGVKPGP
jgi:hypothetical protein